MESGPAEVSDECRKHKRGENTRGNFPPLVSGGSPEKIFELSTPLRAFKCILEAFAGARISVILAKNLASLT